MIKMPNYADIFEKNKFTPSKTDYSITQSVATIKVRRKNTYRRRGNKKQTSKPGAGYLKSVFSIRVRKQHHGCTREKDSFCVSACT